jgi:hypothetical protein
MHETNRTRRYYWQHVLHLQKMNERAQRRAMFTRTSLLHVHKWWCGGACARLVLCTCVSVLQPVRLLATRRAVPRSLATSAPK